MMKNIFSTPKWGKNNVARDRPIVLRGSDVLTVNKYYYSAFNISVLVGTYSKSTRDGLPVSTSRISRRDEEPLC